MTTTVPSTSVVDVPAKYSARVRAFATGQGRKTDATDAHSVALIGTRVTGLRPVVSDAQLTVLRVLVDRRRSLGEKHTRKVNQLHTLLLELVPAGAKKYLSGRQARLLLDTVNPTDRAGQALKRVAVEHTADLERIYARTKDADKELKALVAQTATGLVYLHGIHTMAIFQLRTRTTLGRDYYDRKRANGKTAMEAFRCLKRRVSDVVYRTMLADYTNSAGAGPGGHRGASTGSNAAGSQPHTDTSEKSLPEPDDTDATTPLPEAS